MNNYNMHIKLFPNEVVFQQFDHKWTAEIS